MPPKYVPNICSLVVVLFLAALYFGVFGDLDWSWQVRTGELIVQTGQLRSSRIIFLYHRGRGHSRF